MSTDLQASTAQQSEAAANGGAQPFPLRRLRLAAILLLGLSASAVSWTIWQLRTDAVRAATSESGNIAAVLAAQMSRSLAAIDAVLLEVKRTAKDKEIELPSGFDRAFDNREFQEALMGYRARLPQVFNIAMADRDGKVVVTTAAWPTPDLSAADRDYFTDARSRSDGHLSTSIPSVSKVDGRSIIVFARRLESANGEFAGIIFAVVSTKYFENIYSGIQSVDSLLFTLLTPDGTILFRHPDDHASAGKQLSNKSEWLEALSKGDAGFRVLATADGNVRYVSIRKVPEYPLIVDISITEDTSLAVWRQRATAIGIGSAVFLLFSIYLLWTIDRQVRRLSKSEASLAQKSLQFDAVLDNISQGVTMFDRQQRLIVSNAQFAQIYGIAPECTKPGVPFKSILEARAALDCLPADASDFVAERLGQVARYYSSNAIDKLHDGRTVSITRQPMDDGGWVSTHQDITAQKSVEAELERMARYDALTGLANRTLFMEKADAALARMRRHGETFSILMLDLDRFKDVNDTRGHPAGDALLKEVARRLQKATREVDCVGRLGGDEFAVLQASEKDQKVSVIALAERIRATITKPYDIDGRKLTLETSIGIALAPQNGDDAGVLIKSADLALYRAKTEGRNRYCFFEAGMEAQARAHQELESEMRNALARNEFELHYQTIIDLGQHQCCAAEALVRWNHPQRGFILPGQFIARAEESGLIVPLGEWVLRQACADAARWRPYLKVAVNLSPAQFKQNDLVGVIKAALDDAGLPPQRLELEITESVLLENNRDNLAVLHEIKKLGVAIVLDDFGTGYASLTYVRMFPFDRIKIDRSFIQNMTQDAASAAIVSAVAGLGRNLDIVTTAEGVETREQLELVRAAGCQYVQGYLFSRPVPLSELGGVLQGRPDKSTAVA
jgi:diguanylate cyclase (GGDEF)-like protein